MLDPGFVLEILLDGLPLELLKLELISDAELAPAPVLENSLEKVLDTMVEAALERSLDGVLDPWSVLEDELDWKPEELLKEVMDPRRAEDEAVGEKLL